MRFKAKLWHRIHQESPTVQKQFTIHSLISAWLYEALEHDLKVEGKKKSRPGPGSFSE
jgi:hypothetical protein